MRAEDVLERYVRDVAGQLPVRMRSDVSLELASLLREDLLAKAEAAGRPPDRALALEVVEAFGHPHDVAVRYHPKPAIIDPNDTRNFILTVIIGGAILIAATIPSALLAPEARRDPTTTLVWWVGIAVVIFAVKGWMRRRWPKERRWRPDKHDPDRISRLGMIAFMMLIALAIPIYADPQRVFALLTGGGQLSSWFDYDPVFRGQRLPWLFDIWVAQGLMLTILVIRGRWSAPLRQFNLALSGALCGLLVWYCTGPVMAQPIPDKTAKAYMVMMVFFLLIDIGVKLYQQAGQIRAGQLHDALSR